LNLDLCYIQPDENVPEPSEPADDETVEKELPKEAKMINDIGKAILVGKFKETRQP
jgi:hypothetical protein